MSKINKTHLERSAYIYIRQSTMSQVKNNKESQRRHKGYHGSRARALVPAGVYDRARYASFARSC